MSKPKASYTFGWTDPRMPWGAYVYEVRYAFNPDGYQVVKSSLLHSDVNEVLATVDSRETAEGFIKLLKE